MRVLQRIEQLPLEDWAAGAARLVRRGRRRLLRRPVTALGSAAGVTLVLAIGANALWQQDAVHPAPLWGEAPAPAEPMVAANNAPRVVDAPAESAIAPDPMVAEAQEGLLSAGYYGGPADGVLDGATADAIRAFERDNGLPETGEPSLGLIAAFATASPPLDVAPAPEALREEEVFEAAAAPVVDPSSMGIADVQRLLNDRGYGPLDVDGRMGPRTRDALAKFSAQVGLGAETGMTPAVLRALAGGGA